MFSLTKGNIMLASGSSGRRRAPNPYAGIILSLHLEATFRQNKPLERLWLQNKVMNSWSRYVRVVAFQNTDDGIDGFGVWAGSGRLHVVQRFRVTGISIRFGEVNGNGDFKLHSAAEENCQTFKELTSRGEGYLSLAGKSGLTLLGWNPRNCFLVLRICASVPSWKRTSISCSFDRLNVGVLLPWIASQGPIGIFFSFFSDILQENDAPFQNGCTCPLFSFVALGWKAGWEKRSFTARSDQITLAWKVQKKPACSLYFAQERVNVFHLIGNCVTRTPWQVSPRRLELPYEPDQKY